MFGSNSKFLITGSRWNKEAFLRREDFSRTLPNWTVKEEVNFWLHGEGDDEYLTSDDEFTSDEKEEDSGESELDDTDEEVGEQKKLGGGKVKGDRKEHVPAVGMFWGQRQEEKR